MAATQLAQPNAAMQVRVGGFPIYLDSDVAYNWALKAVAILISPAPDLSEDRRARIDKFQNAARELLAEYFIMPDPGYAEEATARLQALFERTEWAGIFHDPGKRDEVNFWLTKYLTEAADSRGYLKYGVRKG